MSLLAVSALAQADRLASEVDARRAVVLKGNIHPTARPEFDEGPVDSQAKLTYITLMLKRSGSQQAALDQLLSEQQDRFSPNYHKWLTPEQYADRFGLSAADIAKITSWLASEGFAVIDVARGRNWIVFNGTAEQILSALHTEIRRYRVNGELHFANATEPSIPASLAPVVIGFLGLDDFRPKAPGSRGRTVPTAHSDFTDSYGNHYLAPDDLATIYDLTPLYAAGFNGSGQRIVVAGQTDINLTDIQTFRSNYNLPFNDPQLLLVPGSTDPGTKPEDLLEADLDLEWSGAVARNATIIYVYSTDVFTSVHYAIDQNLAPVISLSYTLCEPLSSSIDFAGSQAHVQQANAQGITVLAGSGDSGAADCDRQGQNPQATGGLAVGFPASIPEVTAVGGTQLNEGGGTYWSNTNSPSGGSALSYIPETAWNESGPNGLFASGGGLSVFYAKPSWQTGPGVPGGNARGVPDVSLTAAEHDAYQIVTSGQQKPVWGTSAATPSFAGIVVILNQFEGSAGQGNINPNLYRLAQSTSAVFHDITTGNNIVPCVIGSTPDCLTGSFGYSAGPGYDLVTGLGSVDAYNLITHWNNGAVSTTTTVIANPSSFALNGTTQLTAIVTAVGSSASPTGSVAFNFGGTSLGTATLVVSAGAATATLLVYGSQLPVGADTITASYSGSLSFNASAGSVTVSVSLPPAHSAVVPSVTPNPVYQQQADAEGFSWFYTIYLTEHVGVGTTLTGFTINGTSYATQIVSFFGSSSIPAFGTLSAGVRTKALTVPTLVVFGFSGVDASGSQWFQQLSVPFYGMQITASMALSSQPDTVRQDLHANNSNCQWYQNLALQEQNGHSVHLTRFLAGGNDLSNNIQQWFGSTTLPALGSLLAEICWTNVTTPDTLSYEIDGIDDAGNNVVTTLSTTFEGPAPNPGPLSVSQGTLSLSVSDSSQTTSSNITVNVNLGQQWTVSVFPSNRNTRWLVIYPLSGAGPSSLSILGYGAGLANGVYQATLVFQSVDALPQFIDVPITFTVNGARSALAGSMAQLASGGGWDTTLTLLNTGTTAGEAFLNFFGNDGSPLQLPFTFPQLPSSPGAPRQIQPVDLR